MYTSIPVYTVSVPLIVGQDFRPQIGNDVEPIKISHRSIYQKPLFKFQGNITLLLIFGIRFGDENGCTRKNKGLSNRQWI